jgi:anti-sigma factor RsiW
MLGPLNRLRFALDHRWTPAHASAYLDDELSASERERVERHTADCPECRELLLQLSAMIGALGTLRDEQGELVAGAILSSVRGRLQASPRNGG